MFDDVRLIWILILLDFRSMLMGLALGQVFFRWRDGKKTVTMLLQSMLWARILYIGTLS